MTNVEKDLNPLLCSSENPPLFIIEFRLHVKFFLFLPLPGDVTQSLYSAAGVP